MSKKKGVSLAEKKTRMLDIFYDSSEFYTLKDLEKIAPKQKGIIVGSVKDVLQSLVDDGSVDTDKIGTSVYFWAFPSKVKHAKMQKYEKLQQQVAKLDEKLETLEPRYEAQKDNTDDSEYVDAVVKTIQELQQEQTALQLELENNARSNPEKVESMKSESKKLLEAANRWTDNVFSIKSWCKKKFNLEEKMIDKQFGIPGDFDYVE